ncbi:HAMP domain-containing sensor histidine kinase [Paenibacillus filicis]|uniref:histidine kinase n=1 Tax=Paenibacillus gyeongsangnamensis TaxID=3388067 RepID=A0ABT4Q8C5_9BACL|nr:HAMP domain-containing sensor histidine kinase [Paenibacillus filicis]MCZ8513076.1 HAMP domain-containing sensor histidine kinase [Paenibacillus filicis]
MIKRWLRSLYIQIFLSFLATCVLFFVGLAVFWNYYFTDYFYKGKKELLSSRSQEVVKLLPSYQDGTISTRELRFGIRIIARSINGMVWLADAKGTIMNGSSAGEGQKIPKSMDPMFIEGLKGVSGFSATQNPFEALGREGFLTYYTPGQMNGQPIVILLSVPAIEISETITAVRWNIIVPLLFCMIAVGIILYILSRKLAGPLQQMNRAALEVAGGDFTTRVPVDSNDEVGELARSFNFMVDQLEEWEGTRQEFLANVSHELRSPLTTLRGLITGMLDGVIPSAKYAHYLRICNEEVQRLQRLVNDLLDLARIQNGVDVFRLRPMPLNDKLIEVLEIIRKPAADKRVKLIAVLADREGEPIAAELDPDRFAQIVQNLLYNAIRFTPAGGQVTVEIRAEGDEAVLYVRDTGIGMNETELSRIWDRFYKAQASRTTSAESDGTGLGLTIVKHLVGAMKGTISVSSEVNKGTVFRVAFPLLPHAKPEQEWSEE